MPETTITKRCNKCKKIKPTSAFYKDQTRAVCKICRVNQVNMWQKTKTGKSSNIKSGVTYRKKHPKRYKAWLAIHHAIEDGKLPSASSLFCNCGESAQHYHHANYAPEHHLDVIPVCVSCHNVIHSRVQI